MENLRKQLGNRIRELRQKQHISQEQLAELVNLDRRSISNIERGNTFPLSSLEEIAKVLNTNLKNIFDFEANDKNSKELIADITQKLPNLKLEQLKIIYRLIEVM
jgi:transcriptional regulator with XRE-family HTH domain